MIFADLEKLEKLILHGLDFLETESLSLATIINNSPNLKKLLQVQIIK